jgi:hypothetical protein
VSELRWDGPASFSLGFRVAVVLVKAGENKDHAWQRHVRENPEDRSADIKIFHLIPM